MNSAIDVQHVSFSAGGQSILADVNLIVGAGEHTVICGCSGSGKSTLLAVIAGLLTIEQGSVSIYGELASTDARLVLKPSARGIGMVFQDLGLWSNLTVIDNIRLGLRKRHTTISERKDAVQQAISACRLQGLEKRRPYELSGGEQQRVALARAVALRPRIMLLDEPFGSLDVLLRAELGSMIRQLAETRQMTLVTVIHDPIDAAALSPDKIVVMEDGTVKETVGVSELLTRNPSSRILAAWQDQWRRIHATQDALPGSQN